MSSIPFDNPLHPYTFQLTNYFIKGSKNTPFHIPVAVWIQDIQQALGQKHLGTEITEASNAMIVTPPSPCQASMFSICFLNEFIDYDMLMDPRDGTDDEIPCDAYDDEIDMVGIGHILYVAPHRSYSTFDLFGVSVFEIDGVTLYDVCIDERKLRAANHVQAYQRQMVRSFRRRVKPRKFQKGDLVLRLSRD